ncbi:Protein XRP2 [Amphibalanus amphitrite]|uniref:Protein XRP2 n=1 Tax=Amphibalanus amphitrite TaxID=1232801 RepID=A0A6A4UZN7_AMPAM|nr:Protein XRP2 [Amphibalanus amphitrite]
MGNICLRGLFDSGSPRPEQEEPKKFSWETREKVDMAQYTIEQVHSAEAGRAPGQIGGQQFIVRDCQNAHIYLLDAVNTITVDDCTDCVLIIGAVKGSLFLRNCKQCKVVAACGQFRTRDCQMVDTYLHCSTQPIIEASTNMRFACYRLHYPQLKDHFDAMGLQIFSSCWSNIHDFTPVDGESNWEVMEEKEAETMDIRLPADEPLRSVGLSLDREASLVPLTEGRVRTSGPMALVLFFPDGQQDERAAAFHRTLIKQQPHLKATYSREVKLTPLQLEAIVKTNAYSALVEKDNVIGIQYCGEDVIKHCQKVALETATATGLTGLVYISSSQQAALAQVETLFSAGHVQMAG